MNRLAGMAELRLVAAAWEAIRRDKAVLLMFLAFLLIIVCLRDVLFGREANWNGRMAEDSSHVDQRGGRSEKLLQHVRQQLKREFSEHGGNVRMELFRAPFAVTVPPLSAYYSARSQYQHHEEIRHLGLSEQVRDAGIFSDVVVANGTTVLAFIGCSEWMSVWEFTCENAHPDLSAPNWAFLRGGWTLRDEFPVPFVEHFKAFADGRWYCFVTRDEGAFYVASPKNPDDPGAKRVEKVKDRILAIVNFPDHSYAFTMNEYFRVGKDIQLKPFKPKPVAKAEPYRSRDMLWQCVKVVESETLGK